MSPQPTRRLPADRRALQSHELGPQTVEACPPWPLGPLSTSHLAHGVVQRWVDVDGQPVAPRQVVRYIRREDNSRMTTSNNSPKSPPGKLPTPPPEAHPPRSGHQRRRSGPPQPLAGRPSVNLPLPSSSDRPGPNNGALPVEAPRRSRGPRLSPLRPAAQRGAAEGQHPDDQQYGDLDGRNHQAEERHSHDSQAE